MIARMTALTMSQTMKIAPDRARTRIQEQPGPVNSYVTAEVGGGDVCKLSALRDELRNETGLCAPPS
jgi:hypothetical protein